MNLNKIRNYISNGPYGNNLMQDDMDYSDVDWISDAYTFVPSSNFEDLAAQYLSIGMQPTESLGASLPQSAMAEDYDPSDYTDTSLMGTRFANPRGPKAMMHKAGYLEAPDVTDVGGTGVGVTNLMGGKGFAGFKFPTTQATYVTRDTAEFGGRSKAAQQFLKPYGDIYYRDFLKGMKSEFFADISESDIYEDIEYDAEGREPSGLLPKQTLEAFGGAGTEARALQDLTTGIKGEMTQIGEEIESKEKDIETEEEAIETAKDLYQRQSREIGRGRQAQVLSGEQALTGAQAMAAQTGYEEGPADIQIEQAKEGQEIELLRTQEQRELAQMDKDAAIEASEERKEEYEGDIASLKESVIGEGGLQEKLETAQQDYEDSLGYLGGQDLATAAKEVVDAADANLSLINKATESMFDEAYTRATSKWKTSKGATLRYGYKAGGKKASPKFPYQREMFTEGDLYGVETFKGEMSDVRDRIADLGSYMPSAKDLGGEIDFRDYDWLIEDL